MLFNYWINHLLQMQLFIDLRQLAHELVYKFDYKQAFGEQGGQLVTLKASIPFSAWMVLLLFRFLAVLTFSFCNL